MKKIITPSFRHLSWGFSRLGWCLAHCLNQWWCFGLVCLNVQIQIGSRHGCHSFAWAIGRKWHGKTFKAICG